MSRRIFVPPANWQKIKTIEMHTCGEPLRVVVSGWPEISGQDVLEMRDFVQENHDQWRKSLMWEPRGHADMYGALVTPSKSGDFGVIFMHNEGYSTMCGHATIALGKLAVESGWVKRKEPETHFRIEAPCGLLDVCVKLEKGKVVSVNFRNVPSYVVALDNSIKVMDGLGEVRYDVAFGGAFYAFVEAADLGLEIIPDNVNEFIRFGKQLKRAIRQQDQIIHPTIPELSFLYGVIFVGKSKTPRAHSRNVCVFAEGEVDRSPTGSGVSARMAIHHEKGEIAVGEWVTIESIIGTTFRCRVSERTNFANYDAVIPEVEGTAFVTGSNEFWWDPDDPLHEGFILR